MTSPFSEPLLLNYHRLPQYRDIAPCGIIGCRVTSLFLFLIAAFLLLPIAGSLYLGDFTFAFALLVFSLVLAIGGKLLWQAATDIAEDFRCHVLPAVYFLFFLVSCLVFLDLYFFCIVDDLRPPSLLLLALFVLPTLFLAALTLILLTIRHRWKLRNRVPNL